MRVFWPIDLRGGGVAFEGAGLASCGVGGDADNPGMRRLHVRHLVSGPIHLSEAEAHHARDVLRIEAGERVELFDDGGRTAEAEVISVTAAGVELRAGGVVERPAHALIWTIASAVPKGPRVDWMIEKLSELGTTRFVPLMTHRSVVHPEGRGKRERWVRLATEAAKQSRRSGVMAIDELTPLEVLVKTCSTSPAKGFYCATEGVPARPALMALSTAARARGEGGIVVLIGPEGGWSERELASLGAAGLTAITLGTTILRVETAAIAAAALLAAAATPAADEAGAGHSPDTPS